MNNTKIKKIDEYLLIDHLGDGYNSKVFLGKNIENKEIYAIKVIKDFKKLDDNFLNEIEILSKFDHQNIIKLYKFKLDGEYTDSNSKKTIPFAVLDYCKNGEIFDFISINGGFKENITRKFFIDLIKALNYIHNKGYAHRDLKPENILIDEKFELKIIDFGFSKLLKGDDNKGKLKTVLGTINYMAPEILKKEKYEGKKVDVFSLGVILFILFTGKPPFMQASKKCKYFNLILNNNYDKFWAIHQKFMSKKEKIPENFKQLINSMINPFPEKRLNLDNIINQSWVFGEVADKEIVKEEMKLRKKMIDKENNIDIIDSFDEIKPKFRKSSNDDEIAFIDKEKLLINKNLKDYESIEWESDNLSTNKVFEIKLKDEEVFVIIQNFIENLKGNITNTSNNKIKAEFIINKELGNILTLEFIIYSFNNGTKVKTIRNLGSNLEEFKILKNIKNNFRLLK